ncbi:MAG: fluoride efflux transporter CrcB [Thermoleophilia bacterium]
MSTIAWVAAAPVAALGAMARFGVDRAVTVRSARAIPLGTLTVNTVGAFLLGLLTGAGVGGGPLLVMGGAFLGSFTTFSTWMLETHRVTAHHGPRMGAGNIAVGLATGLAAAGAGWALGAAVLG